jgi:hypothetical protein
MNQKHNKNQKKELTQVPVVSHRQRIGEHNTLTVCFLFFHIGGAWCWDENGGVSWWGVTNYIYVLFYSDSIDTKRNKRESTESEKCETTSMGNDSIIKCSVFSSNHHLNLWVSVCNTKCTC